LNRGELTHTARAFARGISRIEEAECPSPRVYRNARIFSRMLLVEITCCQSRRVDTIRVTRPTDIIDSSKARSVIYRTDRPVEKSTGMRFLLTLITIPNGRSRRVFTLVANCESVSRNPDGKRRDLPIRGEEGGDSMCMLVGK